MTASQFSFADGLTEQTIYVLADLMIYHQDESTRAGRGIDDLIHNLGERICEPAMKGRHPFLFTPRSRDHWIDLFTYYSNSDDKFSQTLLTQLDNMNRHDLVYKIKALELRNNPSLLPFVAMENMHSPDQELSDLDFIADHLHQGRSKKMKGLDSFMLEIDREYGFNYLYTRNELTQENHLMRRQMLNEWATKRPEMVNPVRIVEALNKIHREDVVNLYLKRIRLTEGEVNTPASSTTSLTPMFIQASISCLELAGSAAQKVMKSLFQILYAEKKQPEELPSLKTESSGSLVDSISDAGYLNETIEPSSSKSQLSSFFAGEQNSESLTRDRPDIDSENNSPSDTIFFVRKKKPFDAEFWLGVPKANEISPKSGKSMRSSSIGLSSSLYQTESTFPSYKHAGGTAYPDFQHLLSGKEMSAERQNPPSPFLSIPVPDYQEADNIRMQMMTPSPAFSLDSSEFTQSLSTKSDTMPLSECPDDYLDSHRHLERTPIANPLFESLPEPDYSDIKIILE